MLDPAIMNEMRLWREAEDRVRSLEPYERLAFRNEEEKNKLRDEIDQREVAAR